MNYSSKKRCSKCTIELPIEAFSLRATGYRTSACRPCRNETEKARQAKNPERHRAQVKAWREKNLEQSKAYQKKYHRELYEKNRVFICARNAAWVKLNPEKQAARTKRWRQAHPLECRAYEHRARTRRFGRKTVELIPNFERWLKTNGDLCVYCHGEFEAIDHVVPLSRGGTNHEDNLVPACKSCNSSKGTKLLSEWCSQKEMGT